MNEIIIIIAVIVLLLVILSFLLFFVTKRVNLLMKNTFVDKLNEFDFLIKDKENKISELNEEISNKEKITRKDMMAWIQEIKTTGKILQKDNVKFIIDIIMWVVVIKRLKIVSIIMLKM